MIRSRPYIAAAVALVLAGSVPTLVWALWPEGGTRPGAVEHDPRYATQSGSAGEARRAHIRHRRQEDIDSAAETCGELGVANLARRYAMAPDPPAVARRFADHYEPAFRPGAYRGCLQGLRAGGG